MNTIIHLLFLYSLYNNGILTIEATECCPPSEKISTISKCSNGSRISVLTCHYREVLYSTTQRQVYFDIDDDGVLSITQDEDLGFLLMNPDKYCIGISTENDTEIAIICVNDDSDRNEPGGIELQVVAFLKLILAFLSMLCFGAIAIVYICTPELRDIEGKCIINFSVSLTICHLLQCMAPIIIAFYQSTCDVFSFINNFSVLCGYNWLTVMSIHIWRIVVRPIFRTQMNWFSIYLFYGYGFPIILLITSLISHITNQNELKTSIQIQAENNECWLEGSVIVWFYFYGPLAILVILSALIQLWTAKILWIDRDKRDQNHSIVRFRKKCQMYLHALLVMGTLAIIELSMFPFEDTQSYTTRVIITIIDCRNMVSGGAVFFIFVVLRNKVLKALAKNGLCCCAFPAKWKKLIDEEEDERDIENDEATLTRHSTAF